MNWFRDRWVEIAAFSALAILFVGCIWFAIWDAQQWREYAAKHHCAHTGDTRTETSTYLQPMSCGNNCTTYYPVTTTTTYYLYRCDPGPRGEYVWR